MLCGTIYGDQLERLIPLGHKLVLRARGYNDDIAGFDGLVNACDGCEARSGCEEEDLVDRVDLPIISTC